MACNVLNLHLFSGPENRKGVRAHMTNKYDFNAYDTAIALILTRYLSSTGEVKKELSRVVGIGTILCTVNRKL